MKVYQVAYRDNYSEHNGYEYFLNKLEAKKADNKNKGNPTRDDIEEIEFKLSKKGILSLLNQYASHNDNG